MYKSVDGADVSESQGCDSDVYSVDVVVDRSQDPEMAWSNERTPAKRYHGHRGNGEREGRNNQFTRASNRPGRAVGELPEILASSLGAACQWCAITSAITSADSMSRLI